VRSASGTHRQRTRVTSNTFSSLPQSKHTHTLNWSAEVPYAASGYPATATHPSRSLGPTLAHIPLAQLTKSLGPIPDTGVVEPELLHCGCGRGSAGHLHPMIRRRPPISIARYGDHSVRIAIDVDNASAIAGDIA
jgi:hypothetical protein